MKRSILVAGALAIGVATWLGVRANGNSKDDLREVTVAQFGDFFLYAPLYVAIDKGFFKEQGLKVSLTNTGGDDKTWAAVISGQAHFGVADPTFVAIADARGQPGRVVAELVGGVPFWGVALDPTIRKVAKQADLKGYRVATFPAPSTAYTLQKDMFEDGGLSPNIQQGTFGAQLATVQANQADIALLLEPNASMAVEQLGARVLYGISDYYKEFAITGLTALPSTLQADPELVASVVCGLQKALSYIHQRPDEATELLRARFPEVKSEVATSAMKRMLRSGVLPKTAVTSEKGWQAAISLRKEVGDIAKPKGPEAYIDNRFAEAAVQRCEYKN